MTLETAIERIEVMELRPEDVLIVTIPLGSSNEEADEVGRVLSARLANTFLVVPEQVRFRIVRENDV